jgi:hypothetical protein
MLLDLLFNGYNLIKQLIIKIFSFSVEISYFHWIKDWHLMNRSNFTAINQLFIENSPIGYWRFEVVYPFESETSSSSTNSCCEYFNFILSKWKFVWIDFCSIESISRLIEFNTRLNIQVNIWDYLNWNSSCHRINVIN